jgi:EamA-like transporter family protein
MDLLHGIVLAFLAANIYGFLGIAFELAAKRNYPNWDFTLYKQSFGTLLGLGFTLWLGLPLYRPNIMMMALGGAICYLATLWAYLTASRERDIAANWTIVNLSVILPVLFSIFWFSDHFTFSKGLGVGFTLVSVILIGGFGEKKHPFTTQWVRWITVAFLLNGWLVVLLRFVPEGLGALFTFYFYGLSALLTLLYKLAVRKSWSRSKGIYWVAGLGAATHWSGVMLTILALEVVAKVSKQAGLIVYPITNGLTIALGVVIGSLVLKQKVSSRSAWGVACGSVAMIFLSWS